MKITLILIAMLLLPAAAEAQSPMRVAVYAATTADLLSTYYAVSRGAVETNPIVGHHPARQAAMVLGTAFLADWAAGELASRGHPRIAWIVRAVKIGGHTAATVHNVRLGIALGRER